MPGERSPTLRIGDAVFLRVFRRKLDGCIFAEHASCVAVLPDWKPKDALPNVHFATFRVEVANRDKAQQKRLQGTPVLYGEKIQFVHLLTSKYLTVNISSVSQTEDTNLKLELVDSKTQLAVGSEQFRIVPPNDVRSLGDDVGYGEQFRVESVKIEGYYLHCSDPLLHSVSFSVGRECYELNLSAMESKDCIVSVEPHYQVQKGDHNVFKAGMTVQIVHHKSSAYMRAEGSFATGEVSRNGVYCKVSSSGRSRSGEKSSGSTYWQFEKDGEPCSGDQFLWGADGAECLCRIKHMSTRKYLTVRQDRGKYECVLVSEDGSTDRPLTPPIVIQDLSSFVDTEEAPVVSDVEHTSTSEDSLLFALASPLAQTSEAAVLVKESFVCLKHVATGKWLCLDKDEGVSWDRDEGPQKLTISDSMAYEDAFVLSEVSETVAVLFNTVAGMIPGLKDYIQNVRWREEKQEMIAKLRDLQEFLDGGSARSNPREKKKREKLLRNLGVLPLVVSVIEMHDPSSPNDDEYAVVYKTCFGLIHTYLKSGSAKNKNYLKDEFQRVFLPKLHCNVHAEYVVIDMMKDSRGILSAVTEESVSYVIHHLTSMEKPDPSLLLFLAYLCVCEGSSIRDTQKRLLKDVVSAHGKKLFYPLVEEEGTERVHFVHPVTKQELTLTDDFSTRTSRQDYNFFLVKVQLEFFTALCKGDFEDAVGQLSGCYFTFHGLLKCANEGRAHVHLRKLCLELIQVAFVHVDSNCSFKGNLFIDCDVKPAVVAERREGLSLAHCCERRPGVTFTPHFAAIYVSLKQWILNYLQTQLLVDDVSMVSDVLELLALLVGYGFCYHPEDVNPVVEILISCLRKPREMNVDVDPDVLRRSMEVLSELYEIQLFLKLQVLAYEFTNTGKLESATAASLNGEKELTAKPRGCPDLCLDLVYLSRLGQQMRRPDVLKASLRLLDQLYAFEVNVVKRALEVELVVSSKSHSALTNILGPLRDTKHCLSLNTAGVPNALRTLSELCCGSEERPEQRLIVSSGLLSVLMDYVASQAQKSKTSEVDNPSDLQHVFIVLKMMAHGNSKVQNRIYEGFGTFLSLGLALCGVSVGEDSSSDRPDQKLTALPFMAEMLTEVFSGTPELCLRVNEEHIKNIFKLIIRSKEDPIGQLALLSTLSTIAKVEKINVPIVRMQEVIVRLFSQLKGEFCKELFYGSDLSLDVFRVKLLWKANSSHHQQILLGVTDLLAACAEGENIHIDSMCQTLFSAEELLAILLINTIPVARKIPFARFLVTVFMDVDGDSGTLKILREKQPMLKWLGNIAALLGNLCVVLKDIHPEDHDAVCRELARSTWSHYYSLGDCQPTLPQCQHPTDVLATGELPVIATDGTLTEGVLTFLMEAAMPAVKVFYSKCFAALKGEGGQSERTLLTITKDIFDNLNKLFPVVSQFFTTESQVKLFQSTILCMIRVNETLRSDSLPKKDFLKGSYRTVEQSEEEQREAEALANFRYRVQSMAKAQNIKLMTEHATTDWSLPECVQLTTRDSGLSQLISHFRKPNSTEPTEEAMSVLLYYLRYCRVERVQDDYLDERILHLVRVLLQDVIEEARPRLRLTNPETFRMSCAVMSKLQDSLAKKEAVAIVLPLTAHGSETVSREALAVLSAMLYTGNKEVQKTLISLLQGDPSKVEDCTNITRGILPKTLAAYKSRELILEVMLSRAKEQQLLIQTYTGAEPPRGRPAAPKRVAIDIDRESDTGRVGVEALKEGAARLQEQQVEEHTDAKEIVPLQVLPPGPMDFLSVNQRGATAEGTHHYDSEDVQLDPMDPSVTPAQIRALSTYRLKRVRKHLEDRKNDIETNVKKVQREVQLSRDTVQELEGNCRSAELQVVEATLEIERLKAEVCDLNEQCTHTSQETDRLLVTGRQYLSKLKDSTTEVVAVLQHLEEIDIEADTIWKNIRIQLGDTPSPDHSFLIRSKLGFRYGDDGHNLALDEPMGSASLSPDRPILIPVKSGRPRRRRFQYQSLSPVRAEIERSQLAEKTVALRDEVIRLEEECQFLQDQLEEEKRTEAKLRETLERIKATLRKLQAEQSGLEAEVQEESARLQNLKERRQSVVKTVTEIEERLQSVEERKAELLEENSALEEVLETMRSIHEEMKQYSTTAQPNDLLGRANDIVDQYDGRSHYGKEAAGLEATVLELKMHLESEPQVPAKTKLQEAVSPVRAKAVQELTESSLPMATSDDESPTGSQVQLIGPSDQEVTALPQFGNVHEAVQYTPRDKHEHSPALSYLSSIEVPLSAQDSDSDQGRIVAQLMKSANFSRAKLSLELLGSMCDGQNRDVQNYLREQSGHIKPVNVVGEVALLIQQFFSGTTFKFHHDHLKELWTDAQSSGAHEPHLMEAALAWRGESLGLVDKILRTLIELCVGNYYNQAVVYERQIIDALNAVFRCDVFIPDGNDSLPVEEVQLIKVKSSAVELLEVMMEDTDEDSRQLKDSICGAIDGKALYQTMKQFYQLNQFYQQPHYFLRFRRGSEEVASGLLTSDDVKRTLFRTHFILVSCKLDPPTSVAVKVMNPISKTEVTWIPPDHCRELAGYKVSATSTDGAEVWKGKVESTATNVLIGGLDPAVVMAGGYKFAVAAVDRTGVPSPVWSSDEAWSFCQKRTRSIEVFYTNEEDEKVLTRVHFPYDQQDELRKQLRTDVKWNVNRESPEEKVRDFVAWAKACKKDIDHQEFLRGIWLFRYVIHQRTSILRHRILLALTFLINLLVLISFMVPSSELPPNDQDRFPPDNASFDLTPFAPDFDGVWYWPVIHFILGPVHLFFSVWTAVEFFLVTFPHFSLKPPNWLYNLVGKDPPDGEYLEVKVFGWRTAYILLFVLCSFLGLVLWGYFYCICLLHIVHRNDSLQRVLRAVTKGGQQLLWLALLGLCVLYIYSVVSFAFIHEAFLVESDADLFCRSLGECFITVIRYGLIDGLALNIPLVSGNFSESGDRLIYDLAFFIIVSTIGLDMVTGIIVDSFGELRDEKWKAQEDMENNCFICSIPRHKFDHVGPKEFCRHIECDHCQWDYIYYFVYLGRIDISDHNAIEKQVYETFERDRTDFFPLGAALSLRIVTEEKPVEDKVDDLATRIDGLSRDLTSVLMQLRRAKN